MARQKVPAQISRSGINAVLVAPQFAYDARDSSAGKFWRAGGVRRFLNETAIKLAAMHGGGAAARAAFAKMPVVIVGYSGGYNPTAWSIAKGGLGKRLKGVVLLDGLYGELKTFARWIERARHGFFVSAYTHLTKRRNVKLKQMLKDRNVAYHTGLKPRIRPGSAVFVSADEEHRHYVTKAWTAYPISDLLVRMTGVAKRDGATLSASLAPRR
jgi:hypothetical protein